MAEEHSQGEFLPTQPVDRLIKPIVRFMHVEAASGIVLLLATVAALVLANSPWAESFLGFWKTSVGVTIGEFEVRHSLKHWINDGLMVIFFFVIGLEVKRELTLGELRELNRAILPIVAAIGGMVIPAAVYLAVLAGGEGTRGWGIPMATDIAFVVGCMALLGKRLPHSLRVMLLSLAIVDDIGAILVIAVGYTEALNLAALVWALVGLAAIVVCQRIGVRSFGVYSLLGVAVWFACHESGIHATIAGVVIGLMTPAHSFLPTGLVGDLFDRVTKIMHGGEWAQMHHRSETVRQVQRTVRETISPVEYLEAVLHPWVGFFIMPVFALANAGVPLSVSALGHPVAIAVAAGLLLGKTAGIFAASWLSVQTGIARLPERVSWRMIIGGGLLAGIGFTMALFIAELALKEPLLTSAKIGVIAGSALSAVLGMGILMTLSVPQETPETPHV